MLSKWGSLSAVLILGNKKKLAGARSGLYVGCGKVATLCFAK